MPTKKSGKKMDGESPHRRGRTHQPVRKERLPHSHCRLFCVNVHRVLKFVDKSVNEFSKQLECSQPYLNNLLNGKYEPRLGTAIRISESLGVPLELLITPQIDRLQAYLLENEQLLRPVKKLQKTAV